MRGVAACATLMVLQCSTAEAKQPLDAGSVKQVLMQRGIGQGVKVTEADGTRVVGVLTAIRDDSFDVTPKNTIQATSVKYAQVIRVQSDKSVAAKVGKGIAIGAGVYVAAVVVVLVVIAAAVH